MENLVIIWRTIAQRALTASLTPQNEDPNNEQQVTISLMPVHNEQGSLSYVLD